MKAHVNNNIRAGAFDEPTKFAQGFIQKYIGFMDKKIEKYKTDAKKEETDAKKVEGVMGALPLGSVMLQRESSLDDLSPRPGASRSPPRLEVKQKESDDY